MNPSAVRKRIIRDHNALRTRLDGLENVVLAGGQHFSRRAHELALGLVDMLMQHLDLEDAILVPALRMTDAWGDVRADRLVAHHRAQRDELTALVASSADMAPEELSSRLTVLIADLRADMLREEREILNGEILRDDVVGIDVGSG